jgi:hypothetical protein
MRVLTNAWAWPVKARDRLEWILCTEEVVDALRHTLLDVWTGKNGLGGSPAARLRAVLALAAWQISARKGTAGRCSGGRRCGVRRWHT